MLSCVLTSICIRTLTYLVDWCKNRYGPVVSLCTVLPKGELLTLVNDELLNSVEPRITRSTPNHLNHPNNPNEP